MSNLIIFGGTGSLGHQLIERYKERFNIINFSRDECKQYDLKLQYASRITNYVCDMFNYEKVVRGILLYKPEIIIMAAAMKHIDACENDSEASLNTNVLGIKNILDAVERNQDRLPELKCVVMVSTDKACSPINTYGICKALAEKMTIERALRCPQIKWVVTRYGNVLNSRGSIIPYLHKVGQSDKNYTLTHAKMTRFAMTLDQSVDLIDFAIHKSPSGTITIPVLPSMLIQDLFEIFCQKYEKSFSVVGIKKGEKLNEDLMNEMEASLSRKLEQNLVIFPNFELYHQYSELEANQMVKYDSSIGVIEKENLKQMLIENHLFSN